MTRGCGRSGSAILIVGALLSCLATVAGAGPATADRRPAAPESAPPVAVPPQFERAWGVPAAGPGELSNPDGVARGGSNLYVVDSGRDKVVRYSPTGTYHSEFGSSGSGNGQLSEPAGVATDTAGNVYVADFGNDRVEKFTALGVFVTAWGTPGTATGHFDGPTGVAVDSAGGVYVTDSGNNRVQKFTTSGQFVLAWGAFGNVAYGRFDTPTGVAVDAARNVYVTDWGNDRIQVFDPNGQLVDHWGSSGDGNRQFDGPDGIAIDGSGNRYVVDSGNDRIQKYAADGSLTATWGTTGSANGQFSLPRGIAVDAGGYVYVGDTGNRRIQKFNASSRAYVAQWGTVVGPSEFSSPDGVAVSAAGNVYVVDGAEDRVQRFDTTGTYRSSWGGSGTANGKFLGPVGIAVDGAGNVYVADSGNSRIQKFTATGVFVTAWGTEGNANGQFQDLAGIAVDGAGNVYVTDAAFDPDTDHDRVQKFTSAGAFVRAWGTTGSANGQFDRPAGIATDAAGNVYVADAGNNRIQRFTTNGALLGVWGSAGSGDGQFQDEMTGIAVDSAGNVYVTDPAADPDVGTDRVQQFTTSGAFVTAWGTNGSANGQFDGPAGLGVDGARNVYVTDVGNSRVQKFDPATGIGGTVTERSGQFVAGAWVAVLRTSDFSVAGGAVADSAGRFTVLVPTGAYHLYVIDPTGRHAAGFLGAPDTITVPTGTVVGADPRISRTRGAVTGTIADRGTGSAVAGAWVIAMDGATGVPEVGAVADGAGQYVLDDLRPGNHFVVQADRTGRHAAAYYPSAASFSDALPVAVTAGATASASGAMPGQGVLPTGSTLTGTVTEAGTGAPLNGVFVVVLSASNYRFSPSGVTNSAGQYSLSVPSGTYKLAFIDPTGRHAMEWHNDHPYTGLALADTVTAPATTNAALSPTTGSVTGIVTADPAGPPLAGAWVLAIGPTGVAGGAITGADGRYTISGLAPGTYRAAVIDPTGRHAVVYWNRRTTYAAGDPFTVTAGAATTVDAGVP